MAKEGYKDVSDLYATGEVLPLRSGKLVWVQVLNSFELEQCRTDARVARARVINALRLEESAESQIVRAQYRQGRRDLAVANLVAKRADQISLRVIAEIESDPEWQEMIELIERARDIASREPTQEERDSLAESSQRYVKHIQQREEEERDLARMELDALDDEQLEQAVVDAYIQDQGDRAAMDEYRLAEMALAARTCEAEWDEENERWEHSIPVSEREPIWSKAEVKVLPEGLQQEIQEVLRKLNMTARQAKDWAEVANFSESSVPPNEEDPLQPSTQEEMSAAHPGT